MSPCQYDIHIPPDCIFSLVMVTPTLVAVHVSHKCGCRVQLCGYGRIHRRGINPGVIWGSRHTPLVPLHLLPCGKATCTFIPGFNLVFYSFPIPFLAPHTASQVMVSIDCLKVDFFEFFLRHTKVLGPCHQ